MDEMREAQFQGYISHCQVEVDRARLALTWAEDALVRAKDAFQRWQEQQGGSGLDDA